MHDRGPVQLRPVVQESWARSSSLDPDRLPELAVDLGALPDLRAAHPLAGVLPVVRRLLLEDAEGSGLLVAIGDADGRLLWVEGDRGALDAAERMRFVAGADWSETHVGTSAPGTALVLDRPVQIRGEEHYATLVKGWSCTAVPIHDTDTGRVLGVLDLTGDVRAVGERALPLLTATGVALEAELALARLRRQARRQERRASAPSRPVAVRSAAVGSAAVPSAAVRSLPVRSAGAEVGGPVDRVRDPGLQAGEQVCLRLLGADEARISVGDDSAVLSSRHSEIVAVLAAHPAGLGAADLAAAVYGDADATLTLRAEMVRLRRVLHRLRPGIAPESRPYRFPARVASDVTDIVTLLDRGNRLAALRAYQGPVLPASRAPGVLELRDRIRSRLSESVVEDGSVEALVAWTSSDCGADDVAALRTLLALLPRRSPRRAGVVATLAELEERCGATGPTKG